MLRYKIHKIKIIKLGLISALYKEKLKSKNHGIKPSSVIGKKINRSFK